MDTYTFASPIYLHIKGMEHERPAIWRAWVYLDEDFAGRSYDAVDRVELIQWSNGRSRDRAMEIGPDDVTRQERHHAECFDLTDPSYARAIWAAVAQMEFAA